MCVSARECMPMDMLSVPQSIAAIWWTEDELLLQLQFAIYLPENYCIQTKSSSSNNKIPWPGINSRLINMRVLDTKSNVEINDISMHKFISRMIYAHKHRTFYENCVLLLECIHLLSIFRWACSRAHPEWGRINGRKIQSTSKQQELAFHIGIIWANLVVKMRTLHSKMMMKSHAVSLISLCMLFPFSLATMQTQ